MSYLSYCVDNTTKMARYGIVTYVRMTAGQRYNTAKLASSTMDSLKFVCRRPATLVNEMAKNCLIGWSDVGIVIS